MPSKKDAIEAFLAEIEERFYEVLKAEQYSSFFGGSVKISVSTKPQLSISIREARRPGPKKGSKNKPRIGPRPSAMRAMQEGSSEEF